MFIPRTLAELDRRPGGGALIRALVVGAIFAGTLLLILSANITLGQENLEVGQVADRDIRATGDATFDSALQTEMARDEAAAAINPVTELVEPPADNLDDQLTAFGVLDRRIARVLEELDAGSVDTDEALDGLAEVAPSLRLTQRQLLTEMPPARWEGVVAPAIRSALGSVLGTSVREDELIQARQAVRDFVTNDLPDAERELAAELAAGFVEPNVIVNEERTQELRDQARAEVAPVQVTVKTGQIIVSDGDVLDDQQIETLVELGLTQPRVAAGTFAGNALIAVILASLVIGYLGRFEPGIWHRNRSVFLFLLVLLITAFAIRISADRTLWAFVVPTTAAVLLTAILLHGSAGPAMAAALAVIAGVMNRESLELATYVLAGGTAALLTVTRAERLNVFVRVFAAVAVTNVAVVTAFSLLEQRDVAAIAQLAAAGLVNAALSVILAVGSFAVLGNVFGIMTVFQLLELANPSNRLLRRLLLETPGTYHHSVMVGNLAERAAETIGADPLLARVAAYYHDIGKMKNPLAFIENQGGAHNIHDDLSAETSARIISGHIRDGIDLAYEHGLPVQIIGFIPQHHGTSVMSYFHQKALREAGGRESLVDERTYRYPGPLPQTREAAIIMLADGVEASVRSLDTKDEMSIRAMVDRIVDGRVEDRQLDDSDLTLKDIRQIKDAFVGQLLGMYHTRIKYPDNVVPIEQRREQA